MKKNAKKVHVKAGRAHDGKQAEGRQSSQAPTADGPEVSYIVSAYNRPLMLPVVLYALANQSHQDFEVIVTDNATDDTAAVWHKRYVDQMQDRRFQYVRTAGHVAVSDCYHSAEFAVNHMARGRWLCFPCDDTYLVPEFAARLLSHAHRYGLEFVYSKHVLLGPDANGGGGYAIWDQCYKGLRTVKTCFLVKRSAFPGFNAKLAIPEQLPVGVDVWLGIQMERLGKAGGLDQLLVVHN